MVQPPDHHCPFYPLQLLRGAGQPVRWRSQAVAAGAEAYFPKEGSSEALIKAVREGRGLRREAGIYLSPWKKATSGDRFDSQARIHLDRSPLGPSLSRLCHIGRKTSRPHRLNLGSLLLRLYSKNSTTNSSQVPAGHEKREFQLMVQREGSPTRACANRSSPGSEISSMSPFSWQGRIKGPRVIR